MNSQRAAVAAGSRSRLRRGLALGATAVLGALTLGSAAPGNAASEAFPALGDDLATVNRSTNAVPSQMSQLDFLVGNWKCVVTTQGHGQPTMTNTTYLSTRPILGGHWLEVRSLQLPSTSNPQRVIARQVYGWDPVAQQFTTYYFDDVDGQGTGSAPQVTTGHAVFTGTYLFNGFRHIGRDDLYSPAPDKLYNDVSVAMESTPDQLFPVGTARCDRR